MHSPRPSSTTVPMIGTETIEIVAEPGGRDEDGKVLAGSAQKVTVEGCHVSPRTASELVAAGRESTEDVVRVLLPITAGLTRWSVLVVRGKRYQLDGEPTPFISDDDPDLSGYDVEATYRAG